MRTAINCDAGEGVLWRQKPVEEALWPWVSCFSLACGGHAGSAETLRPLLERAAATGKSVGAHPSYPDREHFGRRPLDLPPAVLRSCLEEQLGFLRDLARAAGAPLTHVKAHGALYHRAMADAETAEILCGAVAAVCPGLPLLGQPDSALAAAAGPAFRVEAFADRTYLPDGGLVERSRPGALLADPKEVLSRCLGLLREGRIPAVDGSWLTLRADTLCLHGDGPNVVETARILRLGLEQAGVELG